MHRESTTYGLDPDRLAEMLQIGCNLDEHQSEAAIDQITAGLLRDRLSQPFPLDQFMGLPISWISRVPCLPAALIPAESVGILLRKPKTPTSALKKLKEYGRTLFSQSENQADRDVGLAIYYGAIANALVFHDILITRFGYAELDESFGTLVEKRWMSSNLRILFEKARQHCQMRSSKRV